MRELLLIGIGTGNPDHITRQGEQAIRKADLILIPRKGQNKSDLAHIREDIIANAVQSDMPRLAWFDMPVRRSEDGYLQGVNEWHDAIALAWQSAIAAVNPAPENVALLIWGDPSLYDSSLRIFARLCPKPALRVVPGITALQALTAAHAIPVNDIGAPFTVTTGRQLREGGWPEGAGTIAVMLDGDCAFQTLEEHKFQIWWGAYLGMAEEQLISGPLADVGNLIRTTRRDARAEHGWIMDIYLLKKLDTALP